MTDTPVEYHRSRYDAPKRKGFMGVSLQVWLIALAVVAIMFSVLIFYLQSARFELKEFNYTDEAVDVEIVEPCGNRSSTPRPLRRRSRFRSSRRRRRTGSNTRARP